MWVADPKPPVLTSKSPFILQQSVPHRTWAHPNHLSHPRESRAAPAAIPLISALKSPISTWGWLQRSSRNKDHAGIWAPSFLNKAPSVSTSPGSTSNQQDLLLVWSWTNTNPLFWTGNWKLCQFPWCIPLKWIPIPGQNNFTFLFFPR